MGTVLKVVSIPRGTWHDLEEVLLEEMTVFRVSLKTIIMIYSAILPIYGLRSIWGAKSSLPFSELCDIICGHKMNESALVCINAYNDFYCSYSLYFANSADTIDETDDKHEHRFSGFCNVFSLTVLIDGSSGNKINVMRPKLNFL